MEKLEDNSQPYRKSKTNSYIDNNNDSVFESPEVKGTGRNTNLSEVCGHVDNNKPVEMRNFAEGSRSTVGSEGRRLESEEFENISISALDKTSIAKAKNMSVKDHSEITDGQKGTAGRDMPVETDKDHNGDDSAFGTKVVANSVGLNTSGVIRKTRIDSFDSVKFDLAHDVIEEEDNMVGGLNDEYVKPVNGHTEGIRKRNIESGVKINEDKNVQGNDCKEADGNKLRSVSENDIWDARRTRHPKQLKKNQSLDEPSLSQVMYSTD